MHLATRKRRVDLVARQTRRRGGPDDMTSQGGKKGSK